MAKEKTILRLEDKLNQLKNRELALFSSYNRHAPSTTKLSILNELANVIEKQDIIKEFLKQ
jgi:hypothetical protein